VRVRNRGNSYFMVSLTMLSKYRALIVLCGEL
jgi:hypothetical protein